VRMSPRLTSKRVSRRWTKNLENNPMHSSRLAISLHTDRLSQRRSSTAERSYVGRIQRAWPTTWMTIGRHCKRPRRATYRFLGFRFHFRTSFNNGLGSDIALCRIGAHKRPSDDTDDQTSCAFRCTPFGRTANQICCDAERCNLLRRTSLRVSLGPHARSFVKRFQSG